MLIIRVCGTLTVLLYSAVTRVLCVQANLSYMELVRQIRETLHKAKFTQNPCLECEGPQTGAPFIC